MNNEYPNLEERWGDFCIDEQRIRREEIFQMRELIDKVKRENKRRNQNE